MSLIMNSRLIEAVVFACLFVVGTGTVLSKVTSTINATLEPAK